MDAAHAEQAEGLPRVQVAPVADAQHAQALRAGSQAGDGEGEMSEDFHAYTEAMRAYLRRQAQLAQEQTEQEMHAIAVQMGYPEHPQLAFLLWSLDNRIAKLEAAVKAAEAREGER